MTAGLTGITLNTILQQPLPSRFLLTVLAVKDDTAVIVANGRALEVHSEIPLQPGQTLLVSQEPNWRWMTTGLCSPPASAA